MRTLALSVCVGILMVACGFMAGGPGTAGYSVTMINDTTQLVTLYAQGVGETKESAVAVGVELGPGATFVDHWVTPNSGSGSARALIRAVTKDGGVAFCRRVSWSDLRSVEFRVALSSSLGAPC